MIPIAALIVGIFLAQSLFESKVLPRLENSIFSALKNQDQFAYSCEALVNKLNIENLTVWSTQYVAAGTALNLTVEEPTRKNTAKCTDSGWGTPVPPIVPEDMCRISSALRTSDRSEISIQSWLPRSWTGRLLSTGNGALGGCIQHEDLAWGNSLGFATVSGNGGHNGTRGFSFYENDESLADFGWRSAHLSLVVGKQMVKSFYGRPYSKAYYYGCSRGGGQGWKEAQAFPDDFDGILVGAAALAGNDLFSWTGNLRLIVGDPQSKSFLPISKWEVVHKNVIEQCDGLDGATDGIIEYPSLCAYDPDQLICGPTNPDPDSCITAHQATTVRNVYADFVASDGTFIYPGLPPSSELEIMPWGSLSGQSHNAVDDYFRFAVYNKPNWDPLSLSYEDIIYARRKDPGGLQVWLGNLTAFAQRGSKLLAYHGTQDGYIPSAIAGTYREHVSRTMNLSSSELDHFYRLFEIGGMGHCSGGSGAWYIGQPGYNPISSSPDQNALMALVQWVEEGVGPETIFGTKFSDNDVSAGIDFQRAHCKYPLRNVFQGGDFKDFRNWQCV
ncbi:hypothetical protein ASPVEDRAFT_138093 [Aspergillus versicolor CBS 583.65]|uniref:Carboxylic ester hydrolase n=1 Tax=Aspergillus versicolor CBS 583.65 TaxID=1036611 RepID=A0A1L9PVJ0_ASPVE|nr:uncharacterized protein ASPVEDRAFT_138093 [Aspergillus versicolor CBS 583.65]OJJ05538.1 hypothetical protein ASPVEDRAFT_138093 [Aspergillus versicolor CBS 583.65]